jgi:hypothetical protein
VAGPAYTDSDIKAANYIGRETPTNATIITAGGNTPTEWLPYLSDRRLAIGYWGTEWTSLYQVQRELTRRLESCKNKWCVVDVLDDAGITNTYVYIDPSSFRENSHSPDRATFREVYSNEEVRLFRVSLNRSRNDAHIETMRDKHIVQIN